MTTPGDGRLWHGGVAGLGVGDLLLPPSVTGNARQAMNRAELLARFPGLDADTITPDDISQDWVHFSPHRQVALAYAGSAVQDFGAGALYVIEPIGDVETDPDLPIQGLRAHSARIVQVYDPRVTISHDRAAKLHAQLLAVERGTSYREQWDSMRRHSARAAAADRPGPTVMISPKQNRGAP